MTRVFLIYGIGGAVHWGGTVGAESTQGATTWLVLYMAGTVMAEAAFLDLSLRYPQGLSRRRLRSVAPYLPAILVLLVVPITPLLPLRILELLAGVVLLTADLMSLAAAVVFFVKWFRATSVGRREHSLTWITGVVVVLGVMALLGALELLPGEPEAWNLMSGLLPGLHTCHLADAQRHDAVVPRGRWCLSATGPGVLDPHVEVFATVRQRYVGLETNDGPDR